MRISHKRFAVFLLFGLTAFAAVAQKKPSANMRTSNMPNDEKAIRNMLQAEYPGFVRSGDAEGYAAQFTKDALWMPPGENNRKGPEAIAASLSAEFDAVQLRPVITVQELSILGDHAYVVGRDELAIIPKDGSAESHVVYTVFWLLRKVNGHWRIARQIWNQKPPED